VVPQVRKDRRELPVIRELQALRVPKVPLVTMVRRAHQGPLVLLDQLDRRVLPDRKDLREMTASQARKVLPDLLAPKVQPVQRALRVPRDRKGPLALQVLKVRRGRLVLRAHKVLPVRKASQA
jgi:hypothetical protein